jgi:hypothetical protein
MKEYKITVDVYAHWGDTPPRYRIYLDGDLMTERDFVWPSHQTFIREHIIVDLEPGQHQLEVEQVGKNGTITQKNVVVDGNPCLAEFTVN